MTTLRRALTAIEKLKAENERLSCQTSNEPIAVIGMACRLPGDCRTPEQLWQLVMSKQSGIQEIPVWRWRSQDFKGLYVHHAGTVEDYREFDAEFFRIAPVEADSLDPQQRMALEVCWETIENSGYAASHFSGTRTGVFMGVTTNDYAQLLYQSHDIEQVTPYFATGNSHCVLAGRLAYTFDMQGPAVALDTACSSSLTSVHLACQSLAAKECDYALAGGVNALLSPLGTLPLCAGQMLSPDGQCHTFDQAANGFVRAEGAGAVLLKRLSDAVRDNDNILAVIKSTHTNQDGTTSGLTVPNGLSQKRLISEALAKADIDPAQVSYVESHGTGTPLGDPIEIGALADAYCVSRSKDSPLYVGALKTNIGHCESAAGIAGLIKTIQALRYQTLPPNRGFAEPNHRIAWDKYPIKILTQATPWQPVNGRRLAGISAFGFSGTNAHVLVEEAPPADRPVIEDENPVHLLTLSAKTAAALDEMKERYGRYLTTSRESATEICYSAGFSRDALQYRLSAVGTDKATLANKLMQPTPGTHKPAVKTKADIAFLFTGQGCQYAGMARELYRYSSRFRHAFDRCCEIIEGLAGIQLKDIVWNDLEAASHRLNQTRYTQVALFSIEYSLYQWWLQQGFRPDYVMGHSVGEYVAACVSGVFSLEDGLRMIEARGRLMDELALPGAMMALKTDSARLRPWLEGMESLSVAAMNGPHNIVVAGGPSALALLEQKAAAEGVVGIPLQVTQGFHSPTMEPVLARFREEVGKTEFSAPSIAIVSNLSGKLAGDEIATPDYWVEHILAPVHFEQSMRMLHQRQVRTFIEIGPHPVLSAMAQEYIPESNWIYSLRRNKPDLEILFASLGKLFELGYSLDWQQVYPNGRRVAEPLPNYPFQRRRHWPKPVAWQRQASQSLPALSSTLGRAVSQPASRERRFRLRYSETFPAFLPDHKLYQIVVVPGSAHVSTMLLAAAEVMGKTSLVLENIQFAEPLVIRENERFELETVVSPFAEGDYRIEIYSTVIDKQTEEPDSQWTLHACSIARNNAGVALDTHFPDPPQEPARFRCQGDEYYTLLDNMGYQLGDSFARIRNVSAYGGMAVGDLDNVTGLEQPFVIYPGLIDSFLQMLGFCVDNDFNFNDTSRINVPFSIDRIVIHRPFDQVERLRCTVVERTLGETAGQTSNQGSINGDLFLQAENGQPLLTLENASLRSAQRTVIEQSVRHTPRPQTYSLQWQPLTENGALQDASPATLPPCVVLWNCTPQEKQRLRLQLGLEALSAVTEFDLYEQRDPAFVVQQLASLQTAYTLLFVQGEECVDVTTHTLAALDVLKRLLRARAASLSQWLWLLPDSGEPHGGDEQVNGELMGNALLDGVNRCLRNEHSELSSRIVRWHRTTPLSCAEWGRLLTASAEEAVRLDEGEVYVRRLLKRQRSSAASPATFTGTTVVTGGFGGIGKQLIQWLIARGAKDIAVIDRGRSEAPPELGKSINLRRFVADVSRTEELEHALEQVREAMPPVRAVFHLAGELADEFLLNQTDAQFADVCAAKVTGTLNLDRLLSRDLQYFVCFSSASVVLGTYGQSNYAAANSFMDRFASLRNARGQRTLSVQWGPWQETGMVAVDHQTKQKHFAQFGVSEAEHSEYLERLDELLVSGEANATVLAIDWNRYLGNFSPNQGIHTFSQLQTEPQPLDTLRGSLHDEMLACPPEERFEWIRRNVKDTIADVLGMSGSHSLQDASGFFDLGMDSMMVLELKKTIENGYGIALAPSVLFNYPTLGEFSRHLAFDLLDVESDVESGETDVDELSTDGLAAMLADELKS